MVANMPFTMGTVDSFDEDFLTPPANFLANREAIEDLERDLLYEDFMVCGIHPDIPVDFNELVERLKSSNRIYDTDVLRCTYSRCVSNLLASEATPTGRKIVEQYMKRRRELISVLESCTGELDAAEKMFLEAENRLSQIKSFPLAYSNEEAKLTVQVVSVHNFGESLGEDNESCVYKLNLECENQAIETACTCLGNGTLFFNEAFAFKAKNEDGRLRISLLKFNTLTHEENPIADCAILLRDLADQKKKELSKELWGHQGEIVLSCQWIYSRESLYSSYLQEFAARRITKENEISEYQKELDKYNGPFYGNPVGLTGVAFATETVGNFFGKQLDDLKNYLTLPGWTLTSQYVAALTFFLSSFAGFTRAVYLDQLIAAWVFWNNLSPQRWTAKRYYFIIASCFGSVCFDLLWLKTYFQAWTVVSVEEDIQNVTKFFSVVLCLWKTVVALTVWRCKREFQAITSYALGPNSGACGTARTWNQWRAPGLPAGFPVPSGGGAMGYQPARHI